MEVVLHLIHEIGAQEFSAPDDDGLTPPASEDYFKPPKASTVPVDNITITPYATRGYSGIT